MRVLDLVVLLVGGSISALLIWLMLVTPFLLYLEEKRNVKLAKGLELGEGVTLLEGIQAYFGEDGHWGMVGALVHIYVGQPTIYFDVRIEHVDSETDLLEPHVRGHGWKWASPEETEEVLAMLVEAALAQRPHPKT